MTETPVFNPGETIYAEVSVKNPAKTKVKFYITDSDGETVPSSVTVLDVPGDGIQDYKIPLVGKTSDSQDQAIIYAELLNGTGDKVDSKSVKLTLTNKDSTEK